MATLTFRGITAEAPVITAGVKRQLAIAWLTSQQPLDGINPPVLPESEITNLVAEIDAEQVERVDLADLGQMVAAEIAYLDSTITGIDGYTAAQVRDVVKRLCQENRAILRALRFVVRQAR